MGLSGSPLSRYMRCRPLSRTSTSPTSLSTRKCFDTCGCATPRSATRSFTGRSPRARRSRISRRLGSATALNASVVVAALAMGRRYSYMGICQPKRTGVRFRLRPRLRPRLTPLREGDTVAGFLGDLTDESGGHRVESGDLCGVTTRKLLPDVVEIHRGLHLIEPHRALLQRRVHLADDRVVQRDR